MILRALKTRGFALSLGEGAYTQTYRVNSVGSETFVPDDLATQFRDRIDAGEAAGLFSIVEDTADSRIDATGGALELLDGSSGNVVIQDGSAFEFANGSFISGDFGSDTEFQASGNHIDIGATAGFATRIQNGGNNQIAVYSNQIDMNERVDIANGKTISFVNGSTISGNSGGALTLSAEGSGGDIDFILETAKNLDVFESTGDGGQNRFQIAGGGAAALRDTGQNTAVFVSGTPLQPVSFSLGATIASGKKLTVDEITSNPGSPLNAYSASGQIFGLGAGGVSGYWTVRPSTGELRAASDSYPIQVASIQDRAGSGPPTFTYGATIASGKSVAFANGSTISGDTGSPLKIYGGTWDIELAIDNGGEIFFRREDATTNYWSCSGANFRALSTGATFGSYKITDGNLNGAPSFPQGLAIPSGKKLTVDEIHMTGIAAPAGDPADGVVILWASTGDAIQATDQASTDVTFTLSGAIDVEA